MYVTIISFGILFFIFYPIDFKVEYIHISGIILLHSYFLITYVQSTCIIVILYQGLDTLFHHTVTQ